MRIYTRTGDGGDTSLQGGRRIAKSHARIAAYGAIDEANAALGMAVSGAPDGSDVARTLVAVQNDLFVAGADLSNPDLGDLGTRVSRDMVRRLESEIDRYESELPPLASFVLPGGDPTAARLHHARTVVRRAEAGAVLLSQSDEINGNCIPYLNRLSDLLFVMGRLVNMRSGRGDVVWKSQKDKL